MQTWLRQYDCAGLIVKVFGLAVGVQTAPLVNVDSASVA